VQPAGQVYYKTPECLIDALPPLVDAPLPASEFHSHKEQLSNDVRRQAEENGVTLAFEPPKDWLDLAKIAQKIRGAGLPAYHDWYIIRTPLFLESEFYADDLSAQHLSDRFSLEVAARFLIGREKQWTDVFYVFARPKGSSHDFKWQILQYRDHESSRFDTVSEYINETSAWLEKRCGDESFWADLKRVTFAGGYGDVLL
jgi:hypothetical protein